MLPMANFSAIAGTAGAQWGRFSAEAKHLENASLEICFRCDDIECPEGVLVGCRPKDELDHVVKVNPTHGLLA